MPSAIETVASDDYLVPFRLLPSDLNQVSARAKQAGLTVNEWVASAVLFCLSKQPSQPSQPALTQPETQPEALPVTVDTPPSTPAAVDEEENPFLPNY
jgi:hypothetical protein